MGSGLEGIRTHSGMMCPRGDKEYIQEQYELRDKHLADVRQFQHTTVSCKALSSE
jgi:hypothetical protein